MPVGPGAPQPPEEVRMLGFARWHEPSVGGHQVDRDEAVDREPEPSLQPADASAEREARNAGVRDHADRTGEAERLRLVSSSRGARRR